jgi:outer membrane protein TolC
MFRSRAALLGAALALCGASLSPRPSSALDLESVLRQVAEANPTLAARREMVEAAQRRIAPAGAWQSPMAELGAVNVPVGGGFDMDPMTMKMVGASQRVPVFGWNRLNRSSAREAAQSEAAGAELTHYEVLGLAWETYADAFYAGELARQAESHRGLMDRLVQSARARYESGSGRLDDVLRAEAERARSLADLAAFRAEEHGARARLDALRGVEPGGPSEALAPPPAAVAADGTQAWQEAVAPSHPRLREAGARVTRYQFAARAARRMAWPDLELRASYGKRQTLADGTAQDNMFTATVGFMVPIFAGQRELSEAAEMDAMARAAEAERRAAELTLRQELETVRAQAFAANRIVRLLADTVVVTQQRALDASWSAYSVGTTDLWRVFEAAHTLYGEEVALSRARQELARAQAQIIAVAARGDLVGTRLPEVKRSER